MGMSGIGMWSPCARARMFGKGVSPRDRGYGFAWRGVSGVSRCWFGSWEGLKALW